MNFLKKVALMATLLGAAGLGAGQPYDVEANSYGDYSGESEGGEATAEDSGFVTPLDFSPLFGGSTFGLSGAASNVAADVFQKVPKQYQSLFDVGSSESQIVTGGKDFFQGQSSDKQFSPESFGFVPHFSQGLTSGLASETVSQPKRYQEKTVEIERTKATAKSSAITRAPHQYDIETKHDNNYKKVKPESDLGTTFQGALHGETTRAQKEEHLAPYKKYSFQKQVDYAPLPTYQALSGNPNPYPQLANVDPKILRYKRYSGSSRKPKSRKANVEQDEESQYDYSSDYKSRPKDFDVSSSYESPDFSNYGDKPNKKEYDYGSDEEYNSDEYEKIKSLSEEQAAEVKKNPENCKKVQKDSMTCMVCLNPKTGGSYESCSYVSEPKNNKYAYVKEQKFDSEDEPENKEESAKSESAQKPEKSQEVKSVPSETTDTKESQHRPVRGGSKYKKSSSDVAEPQRSKTENYYASSKSPKAESSDTVQFAAYRQDENDDDNNNDDDGDSSDEDEEEQGENRRNADNNYEYQSAIPGFFTDNEEKKNVESVLAEFARKDRSACKKVFKNHMTCYQCTDKEGMKNEECMFVSESAPKSSHLAYKEIKEFNSKPNSNNNYQGGHDEAESKVVTSKPTSAEELAPTSAETLSDFTPKLKKNQPLKKYINQDEISKKSTPSTTGDYFPSDKVSAYILSSTVPTKYTGTIKPIVKRHVKSKRSLKNKKSYNTEPSASSLLDQIDDPSDFAGEESKGAFWAETVPKHDKTLGVSLPHFMLERSEQEKEFDEALSSGK